MTFIPIHVHSFWSLLDSTVNITDLVEKAKKLSIPALCLTDHHNIKGVVTFYKECVKNKIKPIIGCELNIKDNGINRITVLAKNKTGYKNIIKLISIGNNSNNIINNEPTISFDDLKSYRSGLIILMGDIKSPLSYEIFDNWDLAYKCNSIELCKSFLKPDWKTKASSLINKYKSISEKFFLYADDGCIPILQVIKDCINELDSNYLPSNNIHYLNEDDKKVHKLLLKAALEIRKIDDLNLENYSDYKIFLCENPKCHLLDELDNGERTLELLNIVEDFSIQESPILPKFKIKSNVINHPDEMLYDLAKKGYVSSGIYDRIKDKPSLKKIYGDRAKQELAVFKKAGISGYFLIVNDIIEYARSCGMIADVRGSASGCLVSHLLGISSVDPLLPDPTLTYSKERELPLERFYNEGRNTKDRAALPDIDIDLPPNFRNNVIEFLNAKYGKDCVGHIITHTRFKGKGAIKEVFKLLEYDNYFEIANTITKSMVDEAKISDELAEIQEYDPGYGIIQWNIDNIPEIKDYSVTYKEAFDIAVKLEKIPKNESIHAAGIIIADQPLDNLFPMRYSTKLDSLVVDIEGSDVEYVGGVKFDILGVSALEKIYQIQKMINNKWFEAPFGIDNKFEHVLYEKT